MASNAQTPRALSAAAAERQPLLQSSQSLTPASVGKLWLVVVVTGLTAVWCVVDSWSHEMNSKLFQIRESKKVLIDEGSWQVIGVLKDDPFTHTLTLTFIQFAFMAVIFTTLFGLQLAISSEKKIGNPTLVDGRWPVLVTSHLFSSVLLQSLMMPSQMMSLAFFAASRALEVPWAAAVRAHAFRTRFGGHAPAAVALMFAAAWTLFFSYTQIAECLCVWSGFGVALTGPALYFMYALLLTVPATKTVYQEAVMVQMKSEPLWALALMNVGACLVFAPLLWVAHAVGYEDVVHGMQLITSDPQISMTVLWLCVQMATLAAAETALICTVDSFWAVAMRSMRVVYWWLRQLTSFYTLSGGMLLSVARPHASFWSFMMLLGLVLAAFAVCTDQRLPGSSKASEEKAAEGTASMAPELKHV